MAARMSSADFVQRKGFGILMIPHRHHPHRLRGDRRDVAARRRSGSSASPTQKPSGWIVKRHGITFVIDAVYDIARDQATVPKSPNEAAQWRAAGVVLEVTRHELSESFSYVSLPIPIASPSISFGLLKVQPRQVLPPALDDPIGHVEIARSAFLLPLNHETQEFRFPEGRGDRGRRIALCLATTRALSSSRTRVSMVTSAFSAAIP
jgi:hypothetical protein